MAALGVDTSASARVAPDDSILDDDAAPLGGAASFGEAAEFSSESAANPAMELVMTRNFFDSDKLVVEEIVGAAVTPGGDIDLGEESVLVDLSTGNDWAAPVNDDGNQFQNLRDIAAGDLDGDGFDEIAAVYVDQSDGILKLRTFDDDAKAGRAELVSRSLQANVGGEDEPPEPRVGFGEAHVVRRVDLMEHGVVPVVAPLGESGACASCSARSAGVM